MKGNMMNQAHTVETIDISIKQAEKYVNKMNSVFNLHKNKDFIDVIEKGYFEEEASRLVLLKADPNLQKPEDQNTIMKSIDAIGYFRQYLSNVISLGRMMEKSLEEDKETRRELMAEE
jgi:hypothetical protein